MFSLLHGGGRFRWTALILVSGICGFFGSLSLANDGGQPDDRVHGTPLAVSGIPVARQNSPSNWLGLWGPYGPSQHGHGGSGNSVVHAWLWEQGLAFRTNGHDGLGYGTLGWADPGLYPGFYGFGMGFHRGYGYGGYGLGVGAGGGDPFYGGPGYPCGGQPYDGGPGYTGQPNALIRPDYNYTGGPEDPNAGMDDTYRAKAAALAGPGNPYFGYESGEGSGRSGGYRGGFGLFTGASSYPFTHPSFTAEAAATGTVFDPFSGAGTSASNTTTNIPTPAVGFGYSLAERTPVTVGVLPLPFRGLYLGIDEEPVADANGVRGMKVTKVHPGTAAEKAGLHAGDIIYSINGYLTTERGNLAWIIAKAAPGNILNMKVRTVNDGKEQTIQAQLPVVPVDTSRPPYLSPVGTGPPPASR
jgi:hypothetical protein